MEDTIVAKRIKEALADDPHKHEVSYLADLLEVDRDQIARVLDEHTPDEGWLPDEIADQYRISGRGDPVWIGYRWPDGSLRDEVFDMENPEHLQEMGLGKIEDA
jgi:hypothetical protein